MQIVKNSGRVFICTDLHGNIHTLHKMLNNVGFDINTDLLIHCGDLIDRGPDSAGTFNHFVEDKTGAFISLRGNHDQFLADCANKEMSGNWVYFNGGQWALHEEAWKVKSMAEAAAKLPVHLTLDFHGRKYGFVHAEVPARFESWAEFTNAVDTDVTEVAARQAMWGRDVIYGQPVNPLPDVEYVFHGHTVLDRPTFVGNRLYLDTGFVFKRLMTLVEITESGSLDFHFRDKYAPRTFSKGDPFIIAE